MVGQSCRAYWLRMTSASNPAFDKYNKHAELEGIPHRVDPTLSFLAPQLREALDVWRTAAKGRTIPCRGDMTPKVMKGFLRHLVLVDVVQAPGGRRFRVRISGTEVERMLGHLPNDFLEEIVPEPYLSRWQGVLDLSLSMLCPIRIFGQVEFRNRGYLGAEIFLAPLGLYAEAPSAILLVAHFDASPDAVGRDLSQILRETVPAA